jgi:MarR-like DNA-binding transcriptional regulator SgrR of sgrS sRNA
MSGTLFSGREFDRRRVLHSGAGLLALLAPARARAQPRRGGTLTVATQGEPRTLVPLLDTNTQTRNISTKIVEGLLTYDRQFTPQPLLATAWTVSADGLAYTFTLRRGVTWHDGREFTAEDVQFSLLTLQKHGPRGRISFAAINRVETPDPHTAIVRLSKPTPYFLKALSAAESPIVPKHALSIGRYRRQPQQQCTCRFRAIHLRGMEAGQLHSAAPESELLATGSALPRWRGRQIRRRRRGGFHRPRDRRGRRQRLRSAA